jgi:hypothetical protein
MTQFEAFGGIAGEGAGDVFEKVARAVAVEIAVFGDEVDVPAGRAGAAAGLVEDPLLPGIGEAVVVGIGAEGEIEADAFAAVAGAEGAARLRSGRNVLAVHLDDERVDALRGHGLGRVDARAGVLLVDPDVAARSSNRGGGL